jgi:uncharacterized protein
MERQPIRRIDGGVRVDVLVVPNASRSHIVGIHGDRVKIRVSAPADRGRANKELLSLLKAATGATQATVVSGGVSRRKSVDLAGISMSAARAGLVGDM